MTTMTMERTKQNVCGIKHCEQPAPHTTICFDCVDDVETSLNQFEAGEIDRLFDIARGFERSADRTARQQHGGKTSAPDALNLGVYTLAQNILNAWPEKLPYLAKDDDAVDLYWTIIGNCERAQAMINGDPKDYANGDMRQVNKTLATPMPLDRLITWLWDTFRIRITRQQIYNWTHRGKIRAYPMPGRDYKIYRPKDVLEHI